MTADQDVDNALNGTDGTNPLSYANVKLRMRTTLNNILAKMPFTYQYSRLDQITTTAEQIAYRYIDADGLVWDRKSVDLVWIEWLKDGAPTNLTPEEMAQCIAGYRANADELRPWPTNDVITGQPYTGMLAGEPTQPYPAYPPVDVSDDE